MAKAKYKDEDPKRPTPVRRDGAYVMMLFIALVAIAGAATLMYLDNEEYGGKSPPKEAELKIKTLGGKADLPEIAPTPPVGGGPGPAPPGGGPGPMPPMGMGPGPMPPMGMGPMPMGP